jgi:outer membrane lipase/esterase
LDNLIENAQKGKPTLVNGQKFYFDNYTDPVCPPATEPLSIYCTYTYRQNNMNYLFADSVHPSGLAHYVLALEVERQIKLWK